MTLFEAGTQLFNRSAWIPRRTKLCFVNPLLSRCQPSVDVVQVLDDFVRFIGGPVDSSFDVITCSSFVLSWDRHLQAINDCPVYVGFGVETDLTD